MKHWLGTTFWWLSTKSRRDGPPETQATRISPPEAARRTRRAAVPDLSRRAVPAVLPADDVGLWFVRHAVGSKPCATAPSTVPAQRRRESLVEITLFAEGGALFRSYLHNSQSPRGREPSIAVRRNVKRRTRCGLFHAGVLARTPHRMCLSALVMVVRRVWCNSTSIEHALAQCEPLARATRRQIGPAFVIP